MATNLDALVNYNSNELRAVEFFSGATTNSTSPIFKVKRGDKVFHSKITGTGAVSATVTYYGSGFDDLATGVVLDTHTLSGTTTASDGSQVTITTSWPYLWAKITNISGTGAAVTALLVV